MGILARWPVTVELEARHDGAELEHPMKVCGYVNIHRPALTFVAAIGLCLGLLIGGQALADGSVSQSRMGMGAGPSGFAPFDALIAQYNASGERFRIDGHCQSACTMFLSIQNVCIVPSARLLFHAGHTQGPNRVVHAGSTNHMMAAYNPSLRSYLAAGGYMDTLAFHTISGRDMIAKFGYPACR
jgi:hypothetical protein